MVTGNQYSYHRCRIPYRVEKGSLIRSTLHNHLGETPRHRRYRAQLSKLRDSGLKSHFTQRAVCDDVRWSAEHWSS